MALVISGVYRQHALPVAWHIVGAQAQGSWIDHICRLLRLLAPAVPATVPVPGLCDQGLGSRDLWAQIVAFGDPLGGHPCLRYQPHITFQPAGQSPRVPVRSLITGPGDLWVGAGRAFRDEPLDSTRGPCLTRVFSGREAVVAAGTVGLPRMWRGQVRRARLSAAVARAERPCGGGMPVWRAALCRGPRRPGCGESDGGVRCGSRAEGAGGFRYQDPPGAGACEVGAGRRPQPHAGPQIAAQQEAAQPCHALLQQAVAARGQRLLVGRNSAGGRRRCPGSGAGLGFLPARAVGHGQQGGNRPAPASGGPRAGIQAARLVPLPAAVFRPRKPCSIQLRQAYRVGSVCATGVSVSSTQGCACP